MSEQEFYPYLDGFSDKQLDFIVARVSCNTDTDAFIKAGFCKTTYYDWSEDDRLKISNTIQQIKRHIAAKLINDMVEKIIENDAAQEKVIKDALDSADKNGFVYFIKQGEKVKIGYSKNVRDRLKQLQTSSPDKLELLGYIEADLKKEQELHQLFDDYRLNGEWFSFTDEVKEFITSLEMNLIAS